MIGQPIRTTNTPPRKKLVAFTLCLWKKNLKVRSNPMTKDRPETKRICRMKTHKHNMNMILTSGCQHWENVWHHSDITHQLTFPIARRALSKNRIIPKNKKNTPNPVSPIPISEHFDRQRTKKND